MKKSFPTIVCSMIAFIALAACTAPGPMQKAEDELAQRAMPSSSGRPIYLRAMKTQFATPRAAIGPLYAGTHCVPTGEVIWDDALFRQLGQSLPKIFRRDAQRAHYQVPPDSGTNVETSAHPDYVEVDMEVQSARAALCMQEEGTSGTVYLKLEWQVHSGGTSSPLYKTATQGSYQAPVMEKHTTAEFFFHAFSLALRDLLAEPGFRNAVGAGAVP